MPDAQIFTGGSNQPQDIDVTSTDVVPTIRVRGISCDTAGTVKIQVQDPQGGKIDICPSLNAGQIFPCVDVVKVYRYTTGTTAPTTLINKADGSGTVPGIRVWG